MRCARARAALLDRESGGGLPAGRAAALERHLAHCPDCSAEAAAGPGLAAQLALLRGAPPFTIDVTRRVLEALAVAKPPEREAVPPRQLAWASSAAVALVLLAGGGLRASLPSLLGAAIEVGRAGAAVAGALAPLLELLGGLARACGGLLSTLAESAATLLPLLERLQPAAAAGAAAAVSAMAATSVFVVGRDLWRSRAARGRSGGAGWPKRNGV
jgi:hypothetical protein